MSGQQSAALFGALILATIVVWVTRRRRRAPRDTQVTHWPPDLYDGDPSTTHGPPVRFTPGRARVATRDLDWLAKTWAPANDERIDAMIANLWDVADRVNLLARVTVGVLVAALVTAFAALVAALIE